MKLNSKEYKTSKTKTYIKITELVFFTNGVTKKSNEWIKTEQSLKNMNLNCYKVLNKTTIYELKNSVLTGASFLISGATFLIKPIYPIQLSKQVFTNKLESLHFTLLGIKLNNKIYSADIIKTINLLDYSGNKLNFYQFSITSLKNYC